MNQAKITQKQMKLGRSKQNNPEHRFTFSTAVCCTGTAGLDVRQTKFWLPFQLDGRCSTHGYSFKSTYETQIANIIKSLKDKPSDLTCSTSLHPKSQWQETPAWAPTGPYCSGSFTGYS